MNKKIIEKFSIPLKDKIPLTYKGKLIIDRTKDDEWGYIEVPNSIRKSRAETHLVVTSLWSTPPYDAHISAFSKEEVQKLPKDFEYEDKEFTFKLSDSYRIFNPEGWDEVYECAVEPVDCFEIQKIRMDLGFTPLMFINHEFHLTLGIRYSEKRQQYEKESI